MNYYPLIFAVLAGAAVFGAYKVVTSRLITHAALFLALTFVAVAGVFLLLRADFLAAIQVLVYAGAVMTVIIFAIMLSDIRQLTTDEAPEGMFERWRTALGSRYWGYLPLLVAGSLVVFTLTALLQVEWTTVTSSVQGTVTEAIGRSMFTKFVVPFEVASLVLLIAMIGAIVLTRKEEA